MSDNPIDLEDLGTLRERVRTKDRSVAARRAEEAAIMRYSERRRLRRADRTEQTNLKFTKAMKKLMISRAEARGLTLTEYFEFLTDKDVADAGGQK